MSHKYAFILLYACIFWSFAQTRKNALKRLSNVATIDFQNFDARPQIRQGLQEALADKDETLAVSRNFFQLKPMRLRVIE